MIDLNPFFWLIVIALLGLVWLGFSEHFTTIGGKLHNVMEETNKIMKDEQGEE